MSEDKGERERRETRREREEMSLYLVAHAVLDSALASLAHHGLEEELTAYMDRSGVVMDLAPTYPAHYESKREAPLDVGSH